MIHVIGSGIETYSHITKLFDGIVKKHPYVYFSVNDPLSKQYIYSLNKNAVDLDDIYFSNSIEKRIDVYRAMADRIIESAENNDVVYIDYGHPLFLNKIVELIVSKASASNIPVKVYPAISAEDCLFADLKISPCDKGWMSFDASNFINKDIPTYTDAHLILWQVGFMNLEKKISQLDEELCSKGLTTLIEKLSKSYGKNHDVVLYEASLSPLKPPYITKCKLCDINISQTSTLTTMYVPPIR